MPLINKNGATSSVNCHINKLYLFCSRQKLCQALLPVPMAAERKASGSGLSHLIMTTHQKCIWPTCGAFPPSSSACRRCQKTQQQKKGKTPQRTQKWSPIPKWRKLRKLFHCSSYQCVCVCVCRLGIKCRWRFMAIGSSSPGNGNESWGPAEAKCSN